MPSIHSFALAFISASLLVSTAALAQHDHGQAPPSAPAEAMHTSPTQAEARRGVEPLFEGKATPKFFEVVLP